MHTVIKKIKKLVPDTMKTPYQFIKAYLAGCLYGFPAKKMLVIGVTGTKGKTSAGNYVWSVLSAGALHAGLISSAIFRYGTTEKINAYHMTMPSPFIIQRELRRMYHAGIRHVVVEMTSEGMKQFRHLGIPADYAIFTNLTPEHLSSHGGSFEKYKEAKTPLFKSLCHTRKHILGKEIATAIIANADSEHAPYYLAFSADSKCTYGIHKGDIRAQNIQSTKRGTSFTVGTNTYETSIPGDFNVYNALPAIAVGQLLDIPLDAIQKGITALTRIPGRMDEITIGQSFLVYVDYAHEPASMRALLDTARTLVGMEHKIILLTGGQGGGRDKRKRAPMAELAGQKADYVIITNEDPYDDDPKAIVEELAEGVLKTSTKKRDTDLFALLDRKEAIEKAFSLAHTGDIVLIAGKGSEQTMMTHAGAIPWNEKEIATEILSKHVHRANM